MIGEGIVRQSHIRVDRRTGVPQVDHYPIAGSVRAGRVGAVKGIAGDRYRGCGCIVPVTAQIDVARQ